MSTVIGFDFGNCFSFPSFVQGIDEETRTGGAEQSLIPPEFGRVQEGIPSRFYYAEGMSEPIVCMEVEHKRIPRGRYKDLLKRHLRESFEMGGRTFTYREAARMVVEDCIRRANKRLKSVAKETTNLISLAYPADYLSDDRQLLVETVEEATLEDGTHLKVVGTIREPAAAALEYLAGEMPDRTDPMTVLVYDLGGGTFDATILTCYPRGIRNAAGSLRYYDEHISNGLKGVGGEDFTKEMEALLRDLVKGVRPEEWNDQYFLDCLAEESEAAKYILSDETSYEPHVGMHRCEPITREMFESRTRDKLMQTIDLTIKMLAENKAQRPDRQPERIILTGGASAMPMVREALLKAFSDFGLPYSDDDIVHYQPSRAISYGAARYGVPESGGGHIIQRTRRDLGIRYMEGATQRSYIGVHIETGSQIPFVPEEFHQSMTARPGVTISEFSVYEATVDDPDRYALDRDWRFIGRIRLDHGGAVPQGTLCEERLVIDGGGTLRVEARRSTDPSHSIVRSDLDWDYDGEDD